jgi:hypothetical protein
VLLFYSIKPSTWPLHLHSNKCVTLFHFPDLIYPPFLLLLHQYANCIQF